MDGESRVTTGWHSLFVDHMDDLSGAYLFADLVTPTKFPSPSYLGKTWTPCMKTAGVISVSGAKLRFHDLRDIFATRTLTPALTS
ncbi:hypothetical protein J2S71_002033 [Olsenella profusa DSM 13989]|nr:hypothetical protein [Olsenella profusa DSM 13989]